MLKLLHNIEIQLILIDQFSSITRLTLIRARHLALPLYGTGTVAINS